ncbi:hypothetical protein [Streptomyces canus]
MNEAMRTAHLHPTGPVREQISVVARTVITVSTAISTARADI